MNAGSEQGRISWLVAIVVVLSVLVDSSGRADDEIEEIEENSAGVVRLPPPDIDARSDFRVADVVSHQYLVVTVDITASGITPESATLIRGPGKANSAIDDLRVAALQGQIVTAEYSMADPRFVRRQTGNHFSTGHHLEVLVSAEAKIYVPLSASITSVIIAPSPGSRSGVSAGGEFNPRNMAIRACQTSDHSRFPACEGLPGRVEETVAR